MKHYTGNVKNPDTIRCRSCPVDEAVEEEEEAQRLLGEISGNWDEITESL